MKTTLINATTPGQQIVKQRRVTLDGDSIDITKSGTAGYGAKELFTFPEGHVMVLGVVCESLRFTGGSGIGNTTSGDYSVGTTATANVSLTNEATDSNLLGSKAFGTFAAKVGDAVAEQATISAPVVLNGSATPAKAYLNVIIDSSGVSADTTGTLLGTFLITYIELGDN